MCHHQQPPPTTPKPISAISYLNLPCQIDQFRFQFEIEIEITFDSKLNSKSKSKIKIEITSENKKPKLISVPILFGFYNKLKRCCIQCNNEETLFSLRFVGWFFEEVTMVSLALVVCCGVVCVFCELGNRLIQEGFTN